MVTRKVKMEGKIIDMCAKNKTHDPISDTGG